MSAVQTYSIYALDTGIFDGRRISGGDASLIEANTPVGFGLHPGEVDHLRQRLNLDAGKLEAYQPPPPVDTELVVHRWDTQARCWVAEPTAIAVAASVREERDSRLAACDWVVARSVERGEQVPAPWRVYRQALRDMTEQAGFPHDVTWPTSPEEFAALPAAN